MNFRLLPLLVLSLLTVGSQAQEPAPVVQPAPHLICEAPEYDFGTADNSQSVEHTFVVRNDGDLTLEISQVRPSCGCTVASITERNVAPGAETRITARLSLTGRQGPQHKVMTVESNDPKQPQFILTLKGVAGSALEIQPARLMLVQQAAGSQPTGAVHVTGLPGTPFHVTAVEANSDRVVATVETVEDGRIYRLNIAPAQPLAPGQLEATVIIRTDHPQRPTVEVPVVFMAKTDLVVAPRELVFPASSTEPITRYIIVRANDNQTFKIANVETPDAEIKTEITPFGPTGFRIQLSNLKPTSNLNQRVIRVHTAIPGQPPLDVPLRVIEPAPITPAAPATP